MAQEDTKKRRAEADLSSNKKPKQTRRLEHVPLTAHYHASWMHAHLVTAVVTSIKHGYVVSASQDGVVKFWKRLPTTATAASDQHNERNQEKAPPTCLEFAKSFTAHAGPIRALAMDPAGDWAASIGADGVVKYYDVSAFDVSSFVSTTKELGDQACWLSSHQLAVSAQHSGEIYIFAPDLVQTLTLHAHVVTCLVKHPTQPCVLSADQSGILEIWNATDTNIGGPLTSSQHGVAYQSKTETDLYVFLRKKTHCVAAAASDTTWALLGADGRIRLLDHATAKVLVTFDERLSTYDKGLYSKSPFSLDAMEYGRRAATEREMAQEATVQKANLQFDPSGQYLLIPTMMGIKCLDWKNRKLRGVIGQADASQLRFLSISLAWGDAKVNQQMQLARGTTATPSQSEVADQVEKPPNDSLLIATAYQQRRIYVFSHIDHGADAERDVWNEAPTVDDVLYHTQPTGADKGASKQIRQAILRTTLGDIHMELFSDLVPKTIENFVGHAKSGYYDGGEYSVGFILLDNWHISLFFWFS